MDLLDRLLGHDRWTTAQLLERCRARGTAAVRRVEAQRRHSHRYAGLMQRSIVMPISHAPERT
jgi:hypothetical protein